MGLGYFGDQRRQQSGADLFSAIVGKGSLVLKSISSGRAEQVRFQRFLWSDDVTVEGLKDSAFQKTGENIKNVPHVLAFQDTTELCFADRQDDIEGLGVLMNRNVSGLYLHPVLAVDPRDNYILGLCGFTEFSFDEKRKSSKAHSEKQKAIEEKASYRWLKCAEEAKTTLAGAQMVTIVSDRESDIFEYLARISDRRNHVLVRSRLDRAVSPRPTSEAVSLDIFVGGLQAVDTRQIVVPARKAATNKASGIEKKKNRAERSATLEIRFARIWVNKPKSRGIGKSKDDPDLVPMTVVDVREVSDEFSSDFAPVHWRILTSHSIKSLDEAWEVVDWYRKRWQIEQLFRSAKKGGLQIEEIALSKADSIKKLAFIGLLAAVRILQLTQCRDGSIDRPATSIFSETENLVLTALTRKYEGKTEKQKNPHKPLTVAWAHWTLARVGGWKGYIKSEGPAGPKTLARGLREFSTLVDGWELLAGKDVCIS